MKLLLAKRDAENARLREQREQYNAELTERKARESVKLQHMQELKELSESRSERIIQLKSEIARHRARLAAQCGEEDLMKYFFEGKVEDVEYVRDLERGLKSADSALDV